ncbi:alpha/beta hydrolase [Acinetobacter sp. WCHAc060033]|uniref:alpha/beta fold hydrolase n=1 Tax=Acinetobacter sp. WCHAc060033 TaxID=2518624 RepID=UPI001022D151|nr:alpha/beta hydrolase [Acinetobacter sp. WCHAc060033]RZG79700.1 alpha/beta hydrolase [Acinetobacter sp. WCHAc060033]
MSELPNKKILHFLNSLLLSLSTLGVVTLSHQANAASNVAENIDYLKVVQEERTWAGLSSKTLRVGDVVWSYSEGGPKNKPTILLIHGLASSRDTWNSVAKSLTPYYHVIIPDLPSAGATQVPANFDLSVPNVTEQLRHFIEAAHIQDNLNIAGHSLGGTIAMFYASQYPFDTKSLFLMSTGGIFKSTNTNYLRNPIYLKQLLITQKGDLDFVMNKVMFHQPFTASIIKNEQEKLFIAKSADTAKIINQIDALNRLYTPMTFTTMLKNIEAPTMILWGAQDQIVNVDVANELKSVLKRPENPIILQRVGHMPLLEAPERVAENYLSFLNKVQPLQNPFSDQKHEQFESKK